MQKHVNLVDLVKSFPTNIYLQNLASIQKRTSPIKFAHLSEKSEKSSISNLSAKDRLRPHRADPGKEGTRARELARERRCTCKGACADARDGHIPEEAVRGPGR